MNCSVPLECSAVPNASMVTASMAARSEGSSSRMLIISIPWLELGFFLSLRLLTDSPGVAEQLAAATQNLALIISGVLCAQMLQQPLEQVGDVVCQRLIKE